ncbi:hypothetical protein AKO1_001075 [Acrasis kona]|uniref:Small ribosomal subunit protein mS29 n=1 Tax=Acrasis kona TaxID=1008807 RepID=A0AAW2ZDN1_9EUKA
MPMRVMLKQLSKPCKALRKLLNRLPTQEREELQEMMNRDLEGAAIINLLIQYPELKNNLAPELTVGNDNYVVNTLGKIIDNEPLSIDSDKITQQMLIKTAKRFDTVNQLTFDVNKSFNVTSAESRKGKLEQLGFKEYQIKEIQQCFVRFGDTVKLRLETLPYDEHYSSSEESVKEFRALYEEEHRFRPSIYKQSYQRGDRLDQESHQYLTSVDPVMKRKIYQDHMEHIERLERELKEAEREEALDESNESEPNKRSEILKREIRELKIKSEKMTMSDPTFERAPYVALDQLVYREVVTQKQADLLSTVFKVDDELYDENTGELIENPESQQSEEVPDVMSEGDEDFGGELDLIDDKDAEVAFDVLMNPMDAAIPEEHLHLFNGEEEDDFMRQVIKEETELEMADEAREEAEEMMEGMNRFDDFDAEDGEGDEELDDEVESFTNFRPLEDFVDQFVSSDPNALRIMNQAIVEDLNSRFETNLQRPHLRSNQVPYLHTPFTRRFDKFVKENSESVLNFAPPKLVINDRVESRRLNFDELKISPHAPFLSHLKKPKKIVTMISRQIALEHTGLLKAYQNGLEPTTKNIDPRSNPEIQLEITRALQKKNKFGNDEMINSEQIENARSFQINAFNTSKQNNIIAHHDLFVRGSAPKNLNHQHVNKFYICNHDDYDKLFSVDGIGGGLSQTFNHMKQRAIMIRKPAIDVIVKMNEKFKKLDESKELESDGTESKSSNGYIFMGDGGSGKSSALVTCVHNAYKNDILVFYIPSAHWWTHGSSEVEPSPLLKGFYDAPSATVRWLKQFTKTNADKLKTMKLSKDYDLPLENKEKQPVTLYDLCVWANNEYFNCMVGFKLLLDELLLDKNTKMLFAVDDYNYFDMPSFFTIGDMTRFTDHDYKPKSIHGREFVLFRALARVVLEDHPNKFFVASYGKSHMIKKGVPNFKDQYLTMVNVPAYNMDEMRAVMRYYESCHKLFKVWDVNEIFFLSGGLPQKVFKNTQQMV